MGFNSRPSLYETLQLGIEPSNAVGVAVAATNLLSGTKAMPALVTADQDVVSQGQFAKTDVIVNKEHSTLALSGMVDVIDLGVYWLSGLIGKPTAAGNVLTYRYEQTSATERNTFTAEMGGTNGTQRLAGITPNDLTITLGTNAASTWAINCFGRAMENGIAMTSNPTRRKTLPVSAKGGSLWIADSVAALTNTSNKLANGMVLGGSFKIDNLGEPTYGFEDVTSYSATTDLQPSITMQISVVKNTRADAFLADYRSATQKFARLLFNGPVVSSVQTSIEFIFPFKFRSPGVGEEANNFVATYQMEAIFEQGFGTALQAKVTQNVVTGTDIAQVTTATASQGTAGSGT